MLMEQEWNLILRNYHKFKKNFYNIFPDIPIENIDLQILKQIKQYIIDNDIGQRSACEKTSSGDEINYLPKINPDWANIKKFRFKGYLTYIHEKKEIEKKKNIDINEKAIEIKYKCHYPAMIEEAKFLNQIAKKLGYIFTNDTIVYYNKFFKTMVLVNQSYMNQWIKDGKLDKSCIDKSRKNEMIEFCDELMEILSNSGMSIEYEFEN